MKILKWIFSKITAKYKSNGFSSTFDKLGIYAISIGATAIFLKEKMDILHGEYFALIGFIFILCGIITHVDQDNGDSKDD